MVAEYSSEEEVFSHWYPTPTGTIYCDRCEYTDYHCICWQEMMTRMSDGHVSKYYDDPREDWWLQFDYWPGPDEQRTALSSLDREGLLRLGSMGKAIIHFEYTEEMAASMRALAEKARVFSGRTMDVSELLGKITTPEKMIETEPSGKTYEERMRFESLYKIKHRNTGPGYDPFIRRGLES